MKIRVNHRELIDNIFYLYFKYFLYVSLITAKSALMQTIKKDYNIWFKKRYTWSFVENFKNSLDFS